MSKKTKQRKVHRRLRVVRLLAYTAVSFTILQYVGVFALAGIRGVYVKTESKLNAFYPKTYVNVELEEKDNSNHVYLMDETGNAFSYDENENRVAKELFVKNPGTNKKDVLVRAKIVAIICSKDGTVIGETQNFEVSGEYLTSGKTERDRWYNSNDGYFYYTSVLAKGTNTKELFQNVRLTSVDHIPEDGWVEFNIIVDTVEVGKTSDGKYVFSKAKAAWGDDTIENLTTLK